MRIAVEATALQGNKSGVGYYTENLLVSVMQAAPEHDYVLLFNRDVPGWRRLGNERVHPRHHMRVRNAWMQSTLPLALREVRPELCHFTNYLAPLACPCPYIVTIHDMTVFITPLLHELKKQLLDRVLIPPVARRAAAIITVSQSARDDIVRYLRVKPSQVRVIPEAAAPQYRPVEDQAELARVRERYALHTPYILYVGTIEPRKNLVRLVEAFARVRAAGLPQRLVLVGQPGWGYQPVYDAVQRFRLTDHVTFTGYVPGGDLPALYTMADVMAFPSLYEGFGLPVVEAMACGTAVLTSRSSSLRELAGDGALLIDPTDVDDIAAGLHNLLTNAVLRADLRERGLRRAAHFTWENAGRATLALYEEVAQAKLRVASTRSTEYRVPSTE